MTIRTALLVFCALAPVITAFVQAPTNGVGAPWSRVSKDALFASSSESWSSTPMPPGGREELGNTNVNAAADARQVRKLVKELGDRIVSLAEKERALEERLAAVEDYSGSGRTSPPSESEGRTKQQALRELEKRLSELRDQELRLEKRLSDIEGSTAGRPGLGRPPAKGPFEQYPSPGRDESFDPHYFDPTPKSVKRIQRIWETSQPTAVQGGSLRTWSYTNPPIDRVNVILKTDGNPMYAEVELWQGPNNSPQLMKVYVEDGSQSLFSAFVDTPSHTWVGPNTIGVRNVAPLEFPLQACVAPDDENAGAACLEAISDVKGETIQGKALRVYSFDQRVDSVVVFLRSDKKGAPGEKGGSPLNAKIELLQGPNNAKQVLDVYTEDGNDRPFYVLIQTPGYGNVVRIVNTGPMEFPIHATVAPFEMSAGGGYRGSQPRDDPRDHRGGQDRGSVSWF